MSKFTKGQRVRPSAAWLEGSGEGRRRFTATVVGFGRDGTTTRVLRDGNRPSSVETFHNSYLEEAP